MQRENDRDHSYTSVRIQYLPGLYQAPRSHRATVSRQSLIKKTRNHWDGSLGTEKADVRYSRTRVEASFFQAEILRLVQAACAKSSTPRDPKSCFVKC